MRDVEFHDATIAQLKIIIAEIRVLASRVELQAPLLVTLGVWSRRRIELGCGLSRVGVEAVQNVTLVTEEVDGVVGTPPDDPHALRHFEALEQRGYVFDVEAVESEPHRHDQQQ